MASTVLSFLCGNNIEDDEENKNTENQQLSHHSQNLRAVFDTLDVNKDGVLTAEELCSWMQKMGLHITQQGLEEIIATSGFANAGGLDFNSFMVLEKTLDHGTMASSSERTTKDLVVNVNSNKSDEVFKDDANIDVDDEADNENDDATIDVAIDDESDNDNDDDDIHEAFNVFDKNKDGLISPFELQSTLSELGLLSTTMSFSRIHSMIRRVDANDDGFINYDEFKSMLNNG